jgi:hypothetical protein
MDGERRARRFLLKVWPRTTKAQAPLLLHRPCIARHTARADSKAFSSSPERKERSEKTRATFTRLAIRGARGNC